MKLITQRKRETHVFLACPSSSGTVHQTESYSFSIPKANTFNTHEIFHIKRFSALSAIAVRPVQLICLPWKSLFLKDFMPQGLKIVCSIILQGSRLRRTGGTPNDTDVVNCLHTIFETGLKVFALGRDVYWYLFSVRPVYSWYPEESSGKFISNN